MKIDRLVRDALATLKRVAIALDNNLTAQDNFGPEGTAGQVLTSNGPNLPPSYQSGGGGGGGSIWHNGAGAPAPALGSDGDYYLDTSSGDVYYKSGGAWI